MENRENLSKTLIDKINNQITKPLNLIEVCGTHTMSIARTGIKTILNNNLNLISGPGCPVCVTSQGYIEGALELANDDKNIIATFGDMLRVPGKTTSLYEQRGKGANIKMVYSPLDCLKIANENKDRRVIFLAVGFETTTPAIALTIKKAQELDINNFYILCGLKTIFECLEELFNSQEVSVDGLICPGNVSVITGEKPYENIVSKFKLPSVICGFEDYEILYGIDKLISQINKNEYKLENAYQSVVSYQGNITAQSIIEEVFEKTDSVWRGFGIVKNSGLKLKGDYEKYDILNHYNIDIDRNIENSLCMCGEIIKGIKKPTECKLFRTYCSPGSPKGPCMVSTEGTCHTYYKYMR